MEQGRTTPYSSPSSSTGRWQSGFSRHIIAEWSDYMTCPHCNCSIFTSSSGRVVNMAPSRFNLLLLLSNLLIPIAILTFATGFFPYKPFLPGIAEFNESSHEVPQDTPPFDRLIFMVVDALRRSASPRSISMHTRTDDDSPATLSTLRSRPSHSHRGRLLKPASTPKRVG